MFDLRKIFDLRKFFAVPKNFLKSKIHCIEIIIISFEARSNARSSNKRSTHLSADPARDALVA